MLQALLPWLASRYPNRNKTNINEYGQEVSELKLLDVYAAELLDILKSLDSLQHLGAELIEELVEKHFKFRRFSTLSGSIKLPKGQCDIFILLRGKLETPDYSSSKEISAAGSVLDSTRSWRILQGPILIGYCSSSDAANTLPIWELSRPDTSANGIETECWNSQRYKIIEQALDNCGISVLDEIICAKGSRLKRYSAGHRLICAPTKLHIMIEGTLNEGRITAGSLLSDITGTSQNLSVDDGRSALLFECDKLLAISKLPFLLRNREPFPSFKQSSGSKNIILQIFRSWPLMRLALGKDETLLHKLADGSSIVELENNSILDKYPGSICYLVSGSIRVLSDTIVLRLYKPSELFSTDIPSVASHLELQSASSGTALLIIHDAALRDLKEKNPHGVYSRIIALIERSDMLIRRTLTSSMTHAGAEDFQKKNETEGIPAILQPYLDIRTRLECRLLCKQWACEMFIGIPKLLFDKSRCLTPEKWNFLIKAGGKALRMAYFRDFIDLSTEDCRYFVQVCPNVEILEFNVSRRANAAEPASKRGLRNKASRKEGSILPAEFVDIIAKGLPRLRHVTLGRSKSSLLAGEWHHLRCIINNSERQSDKSFEMLAQQSPLLEELHLPRFNPTDSDLFVTTRSSKSFHFLRKLIVPGICLTDVAMRYISLNLLNLEHLDISMNSLVTDLGVCELACGPQRWLVLDFSFLPISDISMLQLSEGCGHTLRQLAIRNCTRLTDQGIRSLSAIRSLQLLNLSGCRGVNVCELQMKHVQIIGNYDKSQINRSSKPRASQIAVDHRYNRAL